MTQAEFIAKWRASPKRERIWNSQPHFLALLCRLIGIEGTATAHTWFTFEKGATKSTGTLSIIKRRAASYELRLSDRLG